MNKKEQANAIAKAIVALDSLGFGSSEDITTTRNQLRDLMVNRGYTIVDAGSSRTRAITKKDSIMWSQFQSAKSTEDGTQIERKEITTYRWWRGDDKEIESNHIADLEENASDRIKSMVAQGYSSGDLHAVCYNGNEEIEYTGWWEVK